MADRRRGVLGACLVVAAVYFAPGWGVYLGILVGVVTGSAVKAARRAVPRRRAHDVAPSAYNEDDLLGGLPASPLASARHHRPLGGMSTSLGVTVSSFVGRRLAKRAA
jgi:hypothetical protein